MKTLMLLFILVVSTGFVSAQDSSSATFAYSGSVTVSAGTGNLIFDRGSDDAILLSKIFSGGLILNGNSGIQGVEVVRIGTGLIGGNALSLNESPALLIASSLPTLNDGDSDGSVLSIPPSLFTLNIGSLPQFNPSLDFVPNAGSFTPFTSANGLVINVEAVPEPSTLWLMAASLMVVSCVAHRRFARCAD